MNPQEISPLAMDIIRDPKVLSAHLQSQRAASGAKEFEAALFGSVLEKMEKSLSMEDAQNNDAGHETWCALGVRALSQALANRNVLGIANMIEHSLGVGSETVPALGSLPIPSSRAQIFHPAANATQVPERLADRRSKGEL